MNTRKIIDYKIIDAYETTNWINLGWQPLGGPCYHEPTIRQSSQTLQAVVYYEESPQNEQLPQDIQKGNETLS